MYRNPLLYLMFPSSNFFWQNLEEIATVMIEWEKGGWFTSTGSTMMVGMHEYTVTTTGNTVSFYSSNSTSEIKGSVDPSEYHTPLIGWSTGNTIDNRLEI